MTSSLDSTLVPLNDCGCCAGISIETPLALENRPGATAIAYRVGTHAQFKETLLARLSESNQPALRDFSVRYDDDFTIALLDAWSIMADVLSFYQERLANEAYLRTATERLSVLELARLIDYQLRPGVAAATYLAFTLEDAPGALGPALATGTTAQTAPEPLPPIAIGVGTKVQSIPGPGEQAQTFETTEQIEARVAWNRIRPRLTQPQSDASFTEKSVIFQGTATNLKKGDTLLVVRQGMDPVFKKLVSITVDEDKQTTRVDFDNTPPLMPSYVQPQLDVGDINDPLLDAPLDQAVVQQILSSSWSDEDLEALIGIHGWNANAVASNIAQQVAENAAALDTAVFAFRQRASLFGYNAPKQPTYDGTKPNPPSAWDEWPLDGEASNTLFLDNAYDGVVPASFLTIEKPGKNPAIYQVGTVSVRPRTAYGISGKTTLITLLSGQTWFGLLPSAPKLDALRDVTVSVQSEQLPLAELLIEDLVAGDNLTLDGFYLGLKVGQRIILNGERSDLQGVVGSEALVLKEITIEGGFTVITFEESLLYSYVRSSVVINANVALATNGETVQEVLGGGDGSQAYQRFTLRQPPLTYVSAANPSGAESTLEIRVNDVLWHEVPDLFGHGSDERIFVTRLDDDAKTSVTFGDGQTGARLPTGQENVKAKYRKGIGLGGLVRADQLTQLMTRPLGVKGVTNPIAAAGAADRERLDEARSNAPLTVLTLGRIVSLEDYQDFARAFSGIGKALATWTWFGEKRGVFVTVAGAEGAEVKTESVLYQNLLTAMIAAGDPNVPILVKSYEPHFFRLSVALRIDPDYLREKVFPAVELALRDNFSFAARNFGQPVQLSEVITVVQSVPGVVAVVVKQFYRADHQPDPKPPPRLAAAVPQPGDELVSPAEILILDPRPLGLEELK
jgi:hypothetical protein